MKDYMEDINTYTINSDGLITNGCVCIKKGHTPYSEGTFECNEYEGCIYHMEGRCVFNIATIQSDSSRVCHQLIQAKLFL